MFEARDNISLEGLEHKHPTLRIAEELEGRQEEIWEDLRRMLIMKRDFVKKQREFNRDDPFADDEKKDLFLEFDEYEMNKKKSVEEIEKVLETLNDNALGEKYEMPEFEFDEEGNLVLDKEDDIED